MSLEMRPSARDFQFIASCSRLTLSMTVLRRLDLRPNQVLPSQILANINMLPLQMKITLKTCNQYISILTSTEKIIVSSSIHRSPASQEPTNLVLTLDTSQMTFRYRSWIHGNFSDGLSYKFRAYIPCTYISTVIIVKSRI